MARTKKVLTFSNVIAFVALFVALGGSVYAAGKLSGSQIKPNSIPGNRVKAKTLTGKQIKSGSLTGTQINASTLAGVTASKLASVQYAVAAVNLPGSTGPGEVGPPTTGAANCPPGTNVVGGGATVGNEILGFVNDSGPSTSRTGWTATAIGFAGGTTMTVTAICTSVASVSG